MTAVMGFEVILAIALVRSVVDRLRDRTVSAPRARRYDVFFSEAVVIMGENPDILASWIAGMEQGEWIEQLGT